MERLFKTKLLKIFASPFLRKKAVCQPLPLPLHLFSAKRNDLFLVVYRGVIVVMRVAFVGVEVAGE